MNSETRDTPKKLLCRDKARHYVHMTVLGGALLAPVPIPGFGSTGLTAIEIGLIFMIGRIYDENLSKTEIAMLAASLEVGSTVLSMVVMETLNFVPIAGWLVKVPVAASVVKGIGELAIKHFEDKYPGKVYTQESS
jgi:uncharacterized protein (DUF697 family)